MPQPNRTARSWAKIAFCATLLGLASGLLFAQFVANTRLVELHASVVDKKGKLMTDLPRDDFKVYENGQPQVIKIFKREDVPVSLGIIIDDSGSMQSKRAGVEAAALAMVRASNPEDEVFVVNFNDDAYLDVPFTSDIHKMEQGLARIDSRGGTAMRDAINMSLDYMKAQAKRDKKVIVVITDGNDNASLVSLEKVVNRANQSGTLIYAIGLFSEDDRHEATKAKRALRELTGASGGVAYYPKELNEVSGLALEVARDIRNQYTIAYSPSLQDLDGSYRQIKVVCSAPGKPTVRTRSGYYATPEASTPSKQAAIHPS